MKKFLPILFGLLIFLPVFLSIAVPALAAARDPNTWIEDPEVTFVGKTAARAQQFLSWALEEYSWSSSVDALRSFWTTITFVVYSLLGLAVLATAFIMIVTRGRSVTIMRFLPRFIIIVITIAFSFALIQFLYTIVDIVQRFFLTKPDGKFIDADDLLSVQVNYTNFVGLRQVGSANDESAFISLLLIRLTAATYYAMVGILLIRKIILWFFIIVSPLFPLLLLFKPVRNTAKIWVGEFFRWLLYAPLFAIFLSALVSLWQSDTHVPLSFSQTGVGDASQILYPTAINILLGGPGQQVTIDNSVNLPDTFALYVVALIMLWVVTLLPFLLLQIFLDYFNSFSFSENMMVRQIMNRGNTLVSRVYPPLAPSPAPLPSAPRSGGMAKTLPFAKNFSIPKDIEVTQNIPQTTTVKQNVNVHVSQLANLPVPTMRDIARYETTMLSQNVTNRQEVTTIHETLTNIANPTTIKSEAARQQYNIVREKLVEEKEKGNPLAASILSAANTVTTTPTAGAIPSSMSSQGQTTMVGGVPATQATVGASVLPKQNPFPVVNRVQSVNLDDYEAVKNMWLENYRQLEPPASVAGEKTRSEWVKTDTEQISQAINLLLTQDPKLQQQGMDMVANILPFLLIGGFSQAEVISYLKAKLEAAKVVSTELQAKNEDEETKLDRTERHEEKQKEMSEEIPADLKDPLSEQASGLPDFSGPDTGNSNKNSQ